MRSSTSWPVRTLEAINDRHYIGLALSYYCREPDGWSYLDDRRLTNLAAGLLDQKEDEYGRRSNGLGYLVSDFDQRGGGSSISRSPSWRRSSAPVVVR